MTGIKIPDFSNANMATRIKFWLLSKIAGNSVVILNARIDLVPYDGTRCVRLNKVHGGLIKNVGFPMEDGLILQISQQPVKYEAVCKTTK